MLTDLPFTLAALRLAYDTGTAPEAVIAEAFRRLDAAQDPGIFIHEARDAALAAARNLGPRDGRALWGIPFVVKDNIDVAGMPTTAACPDFEYLAEEDAFVVARLRAAGAICLGKTNLDQFATGLVGVRTPYPVPRNALDPEIVPGGSSSGSAVSVALGVASFGLGTDTAGSGRVPAALNGIVGLKPSLGALSASGMVPACRTLDTISLFAMTVEDAWEVYAASAAYDPADAYARRFPAPRLGAVPPGLRVAIPDPARLITDGDAVQEASFAQAVARLRALGAELTEVDFTPFYDTARMLYEGAWVAERTAAVGDRLAHAPETLHPTTRAIVETGVALSAVDAFRGQYRLAELRRRCEGSWERADMLCVPTIPRFVSRAEIAADPIGPNALLGTYTNFVNLLDLSALAVPTGARGDGRPGSVTLIGRSGEDGALAALGAELERGAMGATGWARPARHKTTVIAAQGEVALAVCGAHMSGLPLNHELTSRGGRFLKACKTAPEYGLHALAGGPPMRPGLVRRRGGAAIDIEIWALPLASVGGFLAGIPAPLSIGTLRTAEGEMVKGFLCESAGLEGATDITTFGGWRAWLDSQRQSA